MLKRREMGRGGMRKRGMGKGGMRKRGMGEERMRKRGMGKRGMRKRRMGEDLMKRFLAWLERMLLEEAFIICSLRSWIFASNWLYSASALWWWLS